MTTPVVLVDEDDESNTATCRMSRADLAALIQCKTNACMLDALPSDEGLDESTCYKVMVKVVS